MASTHQFASGLNNWVASDKPSRADFVNDNAILDEHAMWKREYDPEGAILQQGGLVAAVEANVNNALGEIRTVLNDKANLAELSNIQLIPNLINPNPSCFTSYGVAARYHRKIGLLHLSGRIISNTQLGPYSILVNLGLNNLPQPKETQLYFGAASLSDNATYINPGAVVEIHASGLITAATSPSVEATATRCDFNLWTFIAKDEWINL